MNLDEFRYEIEALHERELFHCVEKCVCMALAEHDHPDAECHCMLDLVYAECARRGKERLYDLAYGKICREPGVCAARLN